LSRWGVFSKKSGLSLSLKNKTTEKIMRDRVIRITFVIMLFFILPSCGKDENSQSLQFNPGDEVVLVNDIGIETYDSGCRVPVCINSDILEEFYWAVKDDNSNEIYQLHMDGSTVNIDCNTRVRIESLYYDKGYKIYVLEGQQYGNEFWVYYELVE
jgi:hypothetical protein